MLSAAWFWRLGAGLSATWFLMGCGASDRPADSLKRAGESCAKAIAADPRLAGEMSVGLVSSADGGDTVLSCRVDTRAGSSALTELGVATECVPEASIFLVLRVPKNDEISVDQAQTEALDNGECNLTFGGEQP